MLKKPIQFEDFDGVVQTEVYYFNLSTPEMTELNLLNDTEGLVAKLEQIAETRDVKAIIAFYTELIAKAYGIRSEDGKRFIKSPELFQNFKESPAFEALLMELMVSENGAADFLLAVAPKKLMEAAQARNAQLPAGIDPLSEEAFRHAQVDPDAPVEDPEPWITQDRNPTKAEIASMTRPQLARAMAAKQDRKKKQTEDNSDREALAAALLEED